MMFYLILCRAYVAERALRKMRFLCFSSIMRQEMGWFDASENSPGTLVTKLATNAESVKSIIADVIGPVIIVAVALVGVLMIAFGSAWKLAFVSMVFMPAFILADVFLHISARTRREKQSIGVAASDRAGQLIAESVGNIRTVTALNLQAAFLRLYRLNLKATANWGMLTQSFNFGMAQCVAIFNLSACYYYSAHLVSNGEISFQDMNRAMFPVILTCLIAGQILSNLPPPNKLLRSARDLYSIIDRPSAIDPFCSDGLEPESVHGYVEFNAVKFAYPERPARVLRSLSFKLGTGQKAAIVGQSGSGKSTVMQLLLRLYDADEGKVMIDGIDVQDYNVRALRSFFGAVTQEVSGSSTTQANI